MEGIPDALQPSWEHATPGRMCWEIQLLAFYRAKDVTIDKAELAHGTLQIDFKWLLRGNHIALRAIFPSAYPEMRPHVLLLGPPEFWPDRHVSPTNGNICLLGRDSVQWRPEDGLGGLLHHQLEGALYGGGPEDPQCEPAEVWWNSIGVQGSYCLVDSAWDLHGVPNGTLTLKVLHDQHRGRSSAPNIRLPRLRTVVTEVRGPDKAVLATWTAPLPSEFQQAKALTVVWRRLETTAYPKGNLTAKLKELRAGHGYGQPQPMGDNLGIRPFALIHPIELSEATAGDGWIMGLDWGRLRDFPAKKGCLLKSNLIPVFRAGKEDIGARVPAFATLAGKRVAVVGVGALGAPIAIELARNGVSALHILDHDTVEPGNSVRWPLGATAWGRHKVEVLKDHIGSDYPGCEVLPIVHALGGQGADQLTDDEALVKALSHVNLVIDASASHGVNRLLWNRCQRAGLPLVRLGATPTLAGGTVSFHGSRGGCPVCIDCARESNEVPTPTGNDDRTTLMQPPGCGERTFSGANYDLQELSLQAVRVAVDVLANPAQDSRVFTLSLRNASGEPIPPSWNVSPLRPQASCPCQAAT